jgi:hypothetical protein
VRSDESECDAARPDSQGDAALTSFVEQLRAAEDAMIPLEGHGDVERGPHS